LLGRVLLSGDEALKQVSSLSGGESARLLFARIMLEKRNVLILDEPTNHMDLEGVAALGDALKAFDGTVLVVSHYRHFVSKVATHILELSPRGVRDFSGSYQEYLEKFGDDYLSRDQPLSSKHRKTKATPSTQELRYDERKKLQSEISKLKKQSTRFETMIVDTEKKIAEIEEKFGVENFFQQASSEEIQNLQTEKQKLCSQLSTYLSQWEASSHKLEAVQARFSG